MLVDLLLSYRATKAWEDMIRLVEAHARADPPHGCSCASSTASRSTAPGAREDAERVLREVLEDHGPSSETLGLLGRVYKDRWEAERERLACCGREGHLDQAIDAYRRGFEADWRDAYPGINAVTLMEIRDPGGATSSRQLLPGRPLREPPAHRRRRAPTTGTTRRGSSSACSRATARRRSPARARRWRRCASRGSPRAPRTTCR